MVVTRIQGYFELDVYWGYKFNRKNIEFKGKITGRRFGEFELRAWGLELKIDSFKLYLDKVGDISFGTFFDGGFVENIEETRRARAEILVTAPRLFREGSRFFERNTVGGKLTYCPLTERLTNIKPEDYLVGTDAAWKFIRDYVGIEKFTKGQFLRQIKSRKIMWFARAPKEILQRQRKDIDRENSRTTPNGGELKLYRLVDLMRCYN